MILNVQVRQKGHAWLELNEIALDAAPTERLGSPELLVVVQQTTMGMRTPGVCAYLSIFFEWSTGAGSTDHYVAKSKKAGAAYEWSNYRLSCLGPNRNKHKFDDVLDPIGLDPETFVINFGSGKVTPNPGLEASQKKSALKTIRRLKLDSPENNKMRARHYSNYVSGDCTLDFVSRNSPFVHAEIVRQRLE